MDVEMKVIGMSYDLSEKSIKDAVHELAGVEYVEVHSEHGTVKVTYDQEEVTLQTICNVIEDKGYIIDK